jgi:hypothetical protein
MASSSQSLLHDFNKKTKTDFNPRIKMEMLEVGKPYFVKQFKLLEVKNHLFGSKKKIENALLAVIDLGRPVDEGCDSTVGDLFLPRRFVTTMTHQKVDLYNKDPNLKIKFGGVGAGREYILELVE